MLPGRAALALVIHPIYITKSEVTPSSVSASFPEEQIREHSCRTCCDEPGARLSSLLRLQSAASGPQHVMPQHWTLECMYTMGMQTACGSCRDLHST